MSFIDIKGKYFRMYPSGKHKGYANKNLSLEKSQTVFLIVDVYGLGFDSHPESTEKSPAWEATSQFTDGERAAISKIKKATDAARKLGLPIIYVSNSAPRIALEKSAYQEQKSSTLNVQKNELFAEDNIDPLEYHLGDSKVLKYSEIVAPKKGDYYIRKHTHSGFFDTRLDTLLRNLGAKTLVCVGFALDMCLGTTMIDALWRNYRIILLRDCTYAVELDGVDTPGSWTNRWILYVECAIGYTCTSGSWIRACNSVKNEL